MDVALSVLICFFSFSLDNVYSVPPAICFQQFKWEDCGYPPKAVIYYYKSGSRCEVGMWRGCMPNPNMFADEYECVQTCIFSSRVRPEDFHNLQIENEIEQETTVGSQNDDTTVAGDIGGNGTDTTGAGNGTTAGDGGTGGTGAAAAGATGGSAGGDATTVAAGEGGAPAKGDTPAEGGAATPAAKAAEGAVTEAPANARR